MNERGVFLLKFIYRSVHHTAISLEEEVMGQRQCWEDFKIKVTLARHL